MAKTLDDIRALRLLVALAGLTYPAIWGTGGLEERYELQ